MLEPSSLLSDSEQRPGDIILPNWSCGQSLAVDLTLVSTFQTSKNSNTSDCGFADLCDWNSLPWIWPGFQTSRFRDKQRNFLFFLTFVELIPVVMRRCSISPSITVSLSLLLWEAQPIILVPTYTQLFTHQLNLLQIKAFQFKTSAQAINTVPIKSTAMTCLCLSTYSRVLYNFLPRGISVLLVTTKLICFGALTPLSIKRGENHTIHPRPEQLHFLGILLAVISKVLPPTLTWFISIPSTTTCFFCIWCFSDWLCSTLLAEFLGCPF